MPQPDRSIPLLANPVTAFVGTASRGPLKEPTLIRSVSQYRSTFGEVAGVAPSAMTLAISGFFANGGSQACVCRLGDSQGRAPDHADYSDFYNSILVHHGDVGLIVLPGQSWPSRANPVILATLRFCEQTRSALLLMDLDSDISLDKPAGLDDYNIPVSSFLAVYAPWIAINTDGTESPLFVPPSGTVAGVISRMDQAQGVWKSPAGTGASVRGTIALRESIDDSQQSLLNTAGINCIRHIPALGPMVWGARTRAGHHDRDWQYIAVRRLAISIEQSILRGTQWVALEPDTESLRTLVRDEIDTLLHQLFIKGALVGRTPHEAYFARYNDGGALAQPKARESDRVIQLGFAPLKPAEFRVLNIRLETHPGTTAITLKSPLSKLRSKRPMKP